MFGGMTPGLGSPNKLLNNLFSSAEKGNGLRNSIEELLQKAGEPSGALQNLASAFEQTAGPTPFGQPNAMAALANVPLGFVDKLLFLSVLRGATQKATEAPDFVLETHISDLLNKLSQIRQSAVAGDTKKLQDMVAKRQHMFDMLRQIIDKYNETSKGIIQSIGR